MYSIRFNIDKNIALKMQRQVSFETVVQAIEDGKILDAIPRPNQQRYPGQEMYVVEINKYAYLVPHIYNEEKKEIFLKTIYPSRRMTKYYLGKKE